MNWISCKERMPDAYDTAITYNVITEEITIGYFSTHSHDMDSKDYNKFICFSEHPGEEWKREELESITHWMPLPEPPIETKKETRDNE